MCSLPDCVSFALNTIKCEHKLKSEQQTTLEHLFAGRDCIAVLPTGFGKSLIYQLLPFIFQKQENLPQPKIALIVAPLNSIIEDQVKSMTVQGVKSCFIDFGGKSGTTYKDDSSSGSEDETENIEVVLPSSVTLDDIANGKYHLVYTHPESLFSKRVLAMLRSPTFRQKCCAVVIDEVHIIAEWGNSFRPAFKKLGDITCLLPDASHLAVTATASPANIKQLGDVLQYHEPVHVIMNPDRPNIYIEVRQGLPSLRKYEKYDSFIQPICEELMEKGSEFPLTIIYVESLEALGYYYQYLHHQMGEHQYVGLREPENRLFAQYHTEYTRRMKSYIVAELAKEKPVLRLVLATVALGMGLNAPTVSRIVHARPPLTMEAYMQEIGRAGRTGQRSSAVMFFNNTDLSSARKGLDINMIEFCKNMDTCLRQQLLKYFGFSEKQFSGPSVDCCSNCRKLCS